MRKWSILAVFALFAALAFLAACSDKEDKNALKAPQNVSAAAINDFIEVVWDKVDKAVEYKVYRKGPQVTVFNGQVVPVEKSSDDWKHVTTVTPASFIDVNVDPRQLQEYSYKVSAVDEKGKEHAVSKVASSRCQAPKSPNDVIAFSSTRASANGQAAFITVNWGWVEGATSYNVYYSDKPFEDKDKDDDEAVIFVRRTSGGAATASYGSLQISENLSSEKTYYFRVTAVTTCGESMFSESSYASTGCINPLDVSGLKAEALKKEKNAIKLTWEPVEGAKEYILTYANALGGTYNTLATVQGTMYNYVGSAGTTYFFKVIARNECGNSQPSSAVSATVECDNAPNAPGTVNANAISTTEIELTWRYSSIIVGSTSYEDRTVTSYQVYRSVTAEGTFSPVGAKIVDKENLSFKDENLTPGTVYFYKVKATNDCGTSAFTSVASDRTLVACVEGEGAVLPAPAAVAATIISGNATAGNTVTISYNRHLNADRYEIYRSETAPNETADVFENGLIATTKSIVFSDSDVRPNKTYYYAVKAVNSCQKSAYSAPANVATECFIPSANSITVQKVSATRAGVNWQRFNGADSYEIYRAAGGNNVFTLRNTAAVTDTFYIDSGLDSTVSYRYYVVGVNPCGKSEKSNQVTLAKTGKECPENGVLNAPHSISAVATAIDKILLSWSGVSIYWNNNPEYKAASYNVYRGVIPDSKAAARIASAVKGTSYEDKPVAASEGVAEYSVNKDRTYYYYVASVDSCGNEGPRSTTNSPFRINQEPAALTGLSADSTGTTVTLRWNLSANANRYVITRIAPTPADTLLGIDDETITWGREGAVTAVVYGNIYTATGLTAGTKYWFKVTPRNVSYDSAATDATIIAANKALDAKVAAVIQKKTKAGQLGAPEVTVTKPAAEIENQLILTWPRIAAATNGYRVYYSATANGDFNNSVSVPQPALPEDPAAPVQPVSYTRSGLAAGTTYYFYVVAYDANGEVSATSTRASGTTNGTAPVKPAAPVWKEGTPSGYYYNATFTHNAGSGLGANSFVEWSTNNGNEGTVYVSSSTTTEFTVQLPIYYIRGTTLTFRAFAVNVAGTSSASATRTYQVPVVAPSNNNGGVYDGSYARVTFNNEYTWSGTWKIDVSTDGGASWSSANNGSAQTNISASYATSIEGQTVQFRATISGSNGTNALSSIVSVQVPCSSPSVNITDNSVNEDVVTLTVLSSVNMTNTNTTVEYNKDGEDWMTTTKLISGSTITVSDLADGIYDFRVTVKNACGDEDAGTYNGIEVQND